MCSVIWIGGGGWCTVVGCGDVTVMRCRRTRRRRAAAVVAAAAVAVPRDRVVDADTRRPAAVVSVSAARGLAVAARRRGPRGGSPRRSAGSPSSATSTPATRSDVAASGWSKPSWSSLPSGGGATAPASLNRSCVETVSAARDRTQNELNSVTQ